MILLALLAALILPPEARPISTGTAAAVLTIGASADLWTTSWALSQGGTRELHPLGRTVEQRVALNLLFVSAGSLLVHRVSRNDPKAGRRALIVLSVTKAVIAAWNIRVGLQARR